jgi:methyl-accepting chemotaxis protein
VLKLRNALANLKIRNKLQLLLLLPCAALAFFALSSLYGNWQVVSETKSVTRLFAASEKMGTAIATLQKERGLSAGFMASKGARLAEELKAQRAVADETLDDLFKEASTFDADPKVSAAFATFRKRVESRAAVRTLVDELSPEADFFVFYSTCNAEALATIQTVGGTTSDPQTATRLASYVSILWAGERSGQERALMNGAYTAGEISRSRLAKVASFVTGQEVRLSDFRASAGEAELASLEQTLQDPACAEVASMRAVAVSSTAKYQIQGALQGTIGYGGLIQEFKDFMLRGDGDHAARFDKKFAEAVTLVDSYRELPGTSAAEVAYLDQIESTLRVYKARLSEAVARRQKGGSQAAPVFGQGKVDDTVALAAFSGLEKTLVGVAAPDWWKASSKRITLLGDTSKVLVREANDYLLASTTSAQFALAQTSLFVLMTFVIVVALALLITRSLVQPMATLVSVAGGISRGELDHDVDLNRADELGELGTAFEGMIEALLELQAGVEATTESQAAGDLDARCDSAGMHGAYAELAQGVNQALEAVVQPLVEVSQIAKAYADGDLTQELRQLPGKQAVLSHGLGEMRRTLNSLIGELGDVIESQKAGDLDARCQAEGMRGAYAELSQGVNEALDAVVLPLVEASEISKAYADGDLSQELRELPGKQVVLSNGLGDMRRNINSLVEELGGVIAAARKGELKTRGDAGRFQGAYREIMGGLNQTLDAVVEPLNDIAGVLGVLAQGNLSARVTGAYEGDFDSLKGACNTLGTQLDTTLQRVGVCSAELDASAQAMKDMNEQILANAQGTTNEAGVASSAAEQVSASVQTVASATEELDASITEIARTSSQAAIMAVDAVRLSNDTNATVKRLGDSSNEIGGVIKLITSIAQQTNLLALNATIEAARAGEAGKGFSVVANEVKDLAARTSEATASISSKIEVIQRDVQVAIGAIAKIGDAVEQVSELQTTIASAVEEQAATTSEIGRSVAESAAGTTEIARTVTTVANAAGDTSLGASEGLVTSESVAQLAGEIRGLVGQFTFSEVNGGDFATLTPSTEDLLVEGVSAKEVSPVA